MPASVGQALRVAAVIALLGAAAALATPPGSLPLALRGLARMLGGRAAAGRRAAPIWRRALAFALVLAAAALCAV